MTHADPIASSATLPATLDERALAALILAAAEPVVVECHYAGWEKPWRALGQADWAQLGREFGSRMRAAVVETGASRAFALSHGVEILPEVMVFLGGRRVARLGGPSTAARVAGAVHEALAARRAEREARSELEAAERHGERPSTVRSVLSRRALAQAG
jgi:thioredoxin-like negative regulator of GroEL